MAKTKQNVAETGVFDLFLYFYLAREATQSINLST